MRLIENIVEFESLLEKLKYENERYGGAFSLVVFKVIKGNKDEFVKFLLDNLRISDSVFIYNDKVIAILEETTIRGAFILNERLKEVIKEQKKGFEYICGVLQLDYIMKTSDILQYLEKRIKIAQEKNIKDCVDDVSKYL